MKWLVGLVVVALVAILWGGFALSVEEPAFRSVLKAGEFELRDYPALVVAETTASGGQREAASEGFRRLAGYIFGANRTKQKIAMTAPVAQQRTSERIAMTAPVAQTAEAGGWVVRFTMPGAYTLATLPEPVNPEVKLRETPPTRYAVVRFSGLARPDTVGTQTKALEDWIAARSLQPTGPATLAQYNPPWTLWFLRRNEVMIPVAP